MRKCKTCGKLLVSGFTTEEMPEEWYCCESCFHQTMDAEFSVGKWRASDSEGAYGGFYEYLDNGEWIDTGIYWTEWEE